MILRHNTRGVLFRELNADEYYIKRLKPNSIKNFIDIGANVGIISILFRLLHTNTNILCVEPHPTTYQGLVSNVANMKINTLQGALGTGQDFYLFKDRKMDMCNSFMDIKTDNTFIKSYTISQIIEYSKLDINDLFIKIDCEGGEKYMFEDKETMNIINKLKMLAIEFHPKFDIKIGPLFNELTKMMHKTHKVEYVNHSDGTLNAIYMMKGLEV